MRAILVCSLLFHPGMFDKAIFQLLQLGKLEVESSCFNSPEQLPGSSFLYIVHNARKYNASLFTGGYIEDLECILKVRVIRKLDKALHESYIRYMLNFLNLAFILRSACGELFLNKFSTTLEVFFQNSSSGHFISYRKWCLRDFTFIL